MQIIVCIQTLILWGRIIWQSRKYGHNAVRWIPKKQKQKKGNLSNKFISPCKLNGAHHNEYIALFSLNTLCHCFLFCTLCPGTFVRAFICHWSLLVLKKRQDGETSRLLMFQRECFSVPRLHVPRIPCPQGLTFPCPVYSWNGSSRTSRTFIKGSYVLFVGLTTMQVSDVTPLETSASNLRWWRLTLKRFWPLERPLALQFFFWREQLNALGRFEIWPCKISALPHSHSLVCQTY